MSDLLVYLQKILKLMCSESGGVNNNWRRESGAYEDDTQRYRIETEVFEMRRYDHNVSPTLRYLHDFIRISLH